MQSENIGSIQCTTHNALQYLKCMFITFCAPVYCWNKTPSNIGSSSCSPQNHFSLTPLSLCVCCLLFATLCDINFISFPRKKNFFLILFHQRCCRRCFSMFKKTLILSIVWCAICEWGKIMNNEIKAENFFSLLALSLQIEKWKLFLHIYQF